MNQTFQFGKYKCHGQHEGHILRNCKSQGQVKVIVDHIILKNTNFKVNVPTCLTGCLNTTLK